MSNNFDSLGSVEYQMYLARFLELENKPMLQRQLVESWKNRENRRNDYKAWHFSKSPVSEPVSEKKFHQSRTSGSIVPKVSRRNDRGKFAY